ncbi:FAD-dependent monooxygenase [Nonomuraea sp. NBC_01738]|uniref:FAD-dependent oxidoreductase n=1 Tax=Nonomuraea sp. NBC_01738 TaxID=2976003 RepID=UPI002E0DA82D|nr:FAD-dependent monooxygenase [Nonomuraea sp. NBC_01738]
MRALICGAGIAGLTLAWHLERAGWDVELAERAPGFRDGGYMIDFYGPGYEAVRLMGLEDALLAVRHPVDSLEYLDRTGRRTSGVTMPPGLSEVVSVLRGDLARVLRDAVSAPTLYGTSIAEISQDAGRVGVLLTGGDTREVDLLVGADGAHSRVRELAWGPQERYLRYLDHHVAAYLLTDEALSARLGHGYRMLTVPGLMAGAYALPGGRVAMLFLRHEPDPVLPESPGEALAAAFGGLGWILPGVLERRPADHEIYYDQVTQVEMDGWSRGRVTLLGDSCQAVSLFAGHGASMAMTAAWTLADALGGGAGGGAGGGTGVEAALAAYEARMRPRIGEVQKFGRRFVRWMAPPSRSRILARDWLLRLASLPGAGRLFLNSLTPGGHSLVPEGAAPVPGGPVKRP